MPDLPPPAHLPVRGRPRRGPRPGRWRRTAALGVALLALAWLPAARAWAGRPLLTETADTADPGAVEIELGGDLERVEDESVWATTIVAALGVVRGLEVRFEATLLVLDPGRGAAQHGLGDSVLGVKYRLHDEGDVAPALLAALTLRLPTGDRDRGLGQEGVDVGVLAAASKTLGSFTVHGNLGYTFATADGTLDPWTLAAAVEVRLAPAWALVAEVVHEILPRARDAALFRAGATWALHEAVRLDAAVGTGLTRGSPDLSVTVGVTLGPF